MPLASNILCTIRQISRITLRQSSTLSSTVDVEEVRRFGELSAEWMDEEGAFKALHSLNQLRVPWILNNIQRKDKQLHLVDIGCGGGLLSIPLARNGFHVTGVDATQKAVDAANENLKHKSLQVNGIGNRIEYHCNTVEDFARERESEFDAVIASEILEHVNDVTAFVISCIRLARSGSPLFFTTINRTWMSKLAAIWLAEDVFRIVPQGVHNWDKFVTPNELIAILQKNNCTVRSLNGFTYDPIANRWFYIPSSSVNFALLATKN